MMVDEFEESESERERDVVGPKKGVGCKIMYDDKQRRLRAM